MAKTKINVMNIVQAAAGGAGAGAISAFVEKKVTFFQEKPKLIPLIPLGMGIAAIMLGKGKIDALGYGLIAASGSQLTEGVVEGMQGFSRVTFSNDETDNMDGLAPDQIARMVRLKIADRKKGITTFRGGKGRGRGGRKFTLKKHLKGRLGKGRKVSLARFTPPAKGRPAQAARPGRPAVSMQDIRDRIHGKCVPSGGAAVLEFAGDDMSYNDGMSSY